MESVLAAWFRKARASNIYTDDIIIRMKALYVTAHLGVDD
jgi:hypothetical protein